MKIAILGWGSLIWQPKELEFDQEIDWQKDGPMLPIEFARISKDGRLTLVITSKGTEVKTLYAISKCKTIEVAVLNLAIREGSGRKSIGSYDKASNQFSHADFLFNQNIVDWINTKDIDGVIWTNLGEKWDVKNEKGGVVQQIQPEMRIEYLKGLKENGSALAEEYIRKAPIQIKTIFRKKIEEELNWTPIHI